MTARVTALLRDERGFSMVAVTLMIMVLSAFSAVAFATTNNDIAPSAKDQNAKAAYSAAEAGINYYLYHLNQDTTYWTKCDSVPGPGGGDPNPVVQQWSGPPAADTRTGHWRNLPGGKAAYAIEVLHATGFAACDPNNQLSMFDTSSGTFSIRSTGQANGVNRSIVASFRHHGFLDFLYFTNYETIDPVANPGGPANCAVWKRDGRSAQCPDITFANNDAIHGPFHTNDQLVSCGTPTLGRVPPDGGPDTIEISNPTIWGTGCGGSSPTFSKPPFLGAPILGMPPTNSSLAAVATPAGSFTGRTIITLAGTNMTVNGGASTPIPANGVIYVKGAGACPTSYDGTPDYQDSANCANVYVQGTYSVPLTIGSENDIIITGNLTHTSTGRLGLIPTNFARVFHPTALDQNNNCINKATGSTTAPLTGVLTPGQNMTIDAAILTLNHSFIVDNWACGTPKGNLTVNGAIAQKFRGPVATGGISITHGYTKDYWYDDRLAYLSPPYFLDPVQSSWKVSRLTEQLPAR
jgi:type II secretory pathway pseudopilin PulG